MLYSRWPMENVYVFLVTDCRVLTAFAKPEKWRNFDLLLAHGKSYKVKILYTNMDQLLDERGENRTSA